MIDITYFGYGVGLPIVGYICGVILRVVLEALNIGDSI